MANCIHCNVSDVLSISTAILKEGIVLPIQLWHEMTDLTGVKLLRLGGYVCYHLLDTNQIRISMDIHSGDSHRLF
jgi:hypothetical protein